MSESDSTALKLPEPVEPGIYPVKVQNADGVHYDCAQWDGECWRLWCEAWDPAEWDVAAYLNCRIIAVSLPERAFPQSGGASSTPEGIDWHDYAKHLEDEVRHQVKMRNLLLDGIGTDHGPRADAEAIIAELARGSQADAKAIPSAVAQPPPPEGTDAELAALRRFKAYVHQRLDDAGVPVDPPSEHREHGCRIGGRLDWLLAKAPAVQSAPPLPEGLDDNRCACCGWPLDPAGKMCRRGDCSMRPLPHRHYDAGRYLREKAAQPAGGEGEG